LTNTTLQKGGSVKSSDLTYYQRTAWKLNDGCTVFDLDTLDGELGYYMMLDSKYVANSEKEWREHKWPKATHYIALENESDEIKFKRTQIKSSAFSMLHDPNMTPTMKQKITCILDLASTRSILTQEQVHNLLFEYIDKTTYMPGSNVEKFNSLVSKLETPKGREELEAHYLLKSALDARVVREKQGAHIWNRAKGPITLGETHGESIEYLLNPKKEALIEELEEEIKIKNR